MVILAKLKWEKQAFIVDYVRVKNTINIYGTRNIDLLHPRKHISTTEGIMKKEICIHV